VEVPMPATDRADLYAVTWRLTRIEDTTGELATTPTGYQVLRFRHTTLHRDSDDIGGVPATSASDNGGNHSRVFIERDRMQFEGWVNNLVGSFSAVPRPPRPGIPMGTLTIEERRFVFSLLTGTVFWSLRDDTRDLHEARERVADLRR
jgi:hypothetical protein